MSDDEGADEMETWSCERCGREWIADPPEECPDCGGEVIKGTP